MEIRLGGFDDFVQADMVMEVTNVDGEFDQRNADYVSNNYFVDGHVFSDR